MEMQVTLELDRSRPPNLGQQAAHDQRLEGSLRQVQATAPHSSCLPSWILYLGTVAENPIHVDTASVIVQRSTRRAINFHQPGGRQVLRTIENTISPHVACGPSPHSSLPSPSLSHLPVPDPDRHQVRKLTQHPQRAILPLSSFFSVDSTHQHTSPARVARKSKRIPINPSRLVLYNTVSSLRFMIFRVMNSNIHSSRAQTPAQSQSDTHLRTSGVETTTGDDH